MSAAEAVTKKPYVIGLCGNPNVGKSTLFNAITGMRQHTGNWTGKTVDSARGAAVFQGRELVLVDIPGAYSLTPMSAEEEVARDFVLSGQADALVVVCDASCLCRNLNLVLQTISAVPRTVICVNLIDEAKKRGVAVDVAALSKLLGVPVVAAAARSGKGVKEVLRAAVALIEGPEPQPLKVTPGEGEPPAEAFFRTAEALCSKTVESGSGKREKRQLRFDRLLTGRALGVPLMLLLLSLVFFITLKGANVPSAFLQKWLFAFGDLLSAFLLKLNVHAFVRGALVDGVYRVAAWVVSVMLPPMAIFFPLFTLLEDLGYLPRVAFNLDKSFARCHACGKQALTICMGFGCNAVGVTGCRIIDSRRERLIAILTNSFIPCNGRFPTIITLLTLFFGGAGLLGGLIPTALLVGVILFALFMSFFVSWLLSKTLLRGVPSAYTLELPPFRAPQVGKVLVRSVLDRTLFVLSRALLVAAPCGLLLYIVGNLPAGSVSLLRRVTEFLDPAGRFFGLDGVLLTAFILGLPANEIVLPIALMGYLSAGVLVETGSLAALSGILLSCGWTPVTALCVVTFSVLHWPCSTTLLTIKKETGSWGWCALAAALPTALGLACCLLISSLGKLLGY